MINFLKKFKKFLLLGLIVLVLAGGTYLIWRPNSKENNGTLVIKRGDFIQTVSVAGKVIPLRKVDLGFNRNGKIVSVPVSVGQLVSTGQIIAELDSREARLSLENAKLALKKLTEGENNQGLTKDYEESLISVNEIFVDSPTIIDGLDQMLNNYTVSTYKLNLPNEQANQYYKNAVASWSQAKLSYDKTRTTFQNLKRPIANEDIIKIAEAGYQTTLLISQATKDSYTYVNYLYNYEVNPDNRSTQLVTDRLNISTWIGVSDALLADLGTNRTVLRNIPLDIKSQELIVEQQTKQYDDHFLRAPFTGTIARLDIKTGEQAVANQAVITLINGGIFQIESFVPEINIANLKVANPARVTLDAYGEETVFEAKIVAIDPAETVRDGVSTYKVTLQFDRADQRIKSGMTANIVLTTNQKTDSIIIPPSAIFNLNGQKFVKVKKGSSISDQAVTVGALSALGQAEILSGLKEGDTIIVNPQAGL